jgi:hypothetical protein
LGGIGAIEVGKMLEVERRGGAGLSRTFALELAYIMENYGNDTSDDAALVLELYLRGAQSLMLAVSFAQRATPHSSTLWQSLINHCLASSQSGEGGSPGMKEDGTLFGSLLEAAALSGADLAHLVKQIPHGMAVEGLRPRLVAAVMDYRLKLQMNEVASAISVSERKSLLRECIHRSRRGLRYKMPKSQSPTWHTPADKGTIKEENGGASDQVVLPPTLRPRQRVDRHSLAYSLPIR